MGVEKAGGTFRVGVYANRTALGKSESLVRAMPWPLELGSWRGEGKTQLARSEK